MLSDEALFAQLLAGQMSAFDALYARHARHLLGFIAAQLQDRAEAEDVLHEVFMTVLREAKAGHPMHIVRAWLFQAARNACLNRVRSQRRAGAALALVHAPEPEAAPAAELALVHHQSAQAVARAVASLPGPLAELYHLRAKGHSYQEVADLLGLPLGTVKSRLHEVVTRLKEAMAS